MEMNVKMTELEVERNQHFQELELELNRNVPEALQCHQHQRRVCDNFQHPIKCLDGQVIMHPPGFGGLAGKD